MSLTLSTNKDTIYDNAALIQYSASFEISGLDPRNYVYSGKIGGVEVTSNSGSVLIRNLDEGTSYSYTGELFCTYTYDYWVEEISYVNGQAVSEWKKYTTTTSVSSGTASVTIYTHPGVLSSGATNISDGTTTDKNIIKNVLTANWINNTWIPHFQKAYKWWYQRNTSYSAINELKVQANTPIEARWFNKCMVAMNTFNKGYKTNYKGISEGDAEGDIITAAIINQLNFSGKHYI